MADTFRLVDKRHDVTAIINEAGPDVGGDIWQVRENSQRIVYSITSIVVDFQNERLYFEVPEEILFDPLQPIFVKINYKSLVFKILPGEYKAFHSKLTSKFPKEGRALEFRCESRSIIRPKLYLPIMMRPTISNTMARIEGTIVDVSTKGVGVAINERYKYLVFKDSVFNILNIAGLDLNGDLQGKVMNLPGRVWGIKNGEFKAGIKYSEVLSPEVYQHILLKSK